MTTDTYDPVMASLSSTPGLAEVANFVKSLTEKVDDDDADTTAFRLPIALAKEKANVQRKLRAAQQDYVKVIN